MFTKEFLRGAAERAVKTFLQVFVAVLVASAGSGAIGISAGLGSVSWLDALSVAALATVLSFATSVGNTEFVAGVQNKIEK